MVRQVSHGDEWLGKAGTDKPMDNKRTNRMITNQQLLKAYVEQVKGLRVLKGDNIEIFIPFLCLDIVQTFYKDYIKDIKPEDFEPSLRGSWFTKFRKLRKNWYDNFQDIMGTKTFWDKFDEDVKDAIIDKMDDFEQYIGNYVTMAKVAVMKVIDPMPLEQQQIVSSCLIAEVLIWSGMDVWEKCLKDKENDTYEWRHGELTKMELKKQYKVWDAAFKADHRKMVALQKSIHTFLNYFYKPTKRITIGENPLCTNEITLLCRKIVHFLLDEKNNEN